MDPEELERMVVRIMADYVDYARGMQQVSRIADQTFANIRRAGVRLSLAISAPLALLGRKSVQDFAKFEDRMIKTFAIMGEEDAAMKKMMIDSAKELSSTTITPIDDIANAYERLAASNYDAMQATKAMPFLNKFAIASQWELSEATDSLIKAQTSLGFASQDPTKNLAGLEKVANILTKAGNLSLTKPSEMVRAINTKYGAQLNQLNKGPEEGAAVLAAFAQRGAVGESGGEQAYMMTRDMQSAVLKNAQAWAKLELSVYDSDGQMLHTADILEQLEKKLAGASDEQVKMTLSVLGFTDRSVAATQKLIGASQEIRNYETAIRGAKDTVEELAAANQTSFLASLKITQNILQNLRIEIGERLVPYVQMFNASLIWLAQTFMTLDPYIQDIIIGFGVFMAVLGPTLIFVGLTGQAFIAMGRGIVFVWGVAQGFFGFLFTAVRTAVVFVASLNPALLLIGATIALLTLAIMGPEGFGMAWDWVKEKVAAFWDFVQAFMSDFGENMSRLGSWFKENWFNILKDMVKATGYFFFNMASNAIEAIKLIARSMKDLLKESWKWLKGDGTAFNEAFFDKLKENVEQAADATRTPLQGVEWSTKPFELSDTRSKTDTAARVGALAKGIRAATYNIDQNTMEGQNVGPNSVLQELLDQLIGTGDAGGPGDRRGNNDVPALIKDSVEAYSALYNSRMLDPDKNADPQAVTAKNSDATVAELKSQTSLLEQIRDELVKGNVGANF